MSPLSNLLALSISGIMVATFCINFSGYTEICCIENQIAEELKDDNGFFFFGN